MGRKCVSGAALVLQTMDSRGNVVDSVVSEVGSEDHVDTIVTR